jgi:hypothetical protein
MPQLMQKHINIRVYLNEVSEVSHSLSQFMFFTLLRLLLFVTPGGRETELLT